MAERRITRAPAPRADGHARAPPRRSRRSSRPAPARPSALGVASATASAAVAPARRPRARPPSDSRHARADAASRRPRASCSSTTGTRYIGETTSQTFEDKYGIKVKYDKFPDADDPDGEDPQRRQGWRLRRHATRPRPRSRRSSRDGVIQPLDLALIPNVVNLGAGVAEPGLRPGQRVLDPELLVDDRASPGTRARSRATSTSWDALWDPTVQGHLGDARRLAGGVRGRGAFRLGLDPNTTDDADLDQALALLEQQKPLLRKYTDDDIGDMTSGARSG